MPKSLGQFFCTNAKLILIGVGFLATPDLFPDNKGDVKPRSAEEELKARETRVSAAAKMAKRIDLYHQFSSDPDIAKLILEHITARTPNGMDAEDTSSGSAAGLARAFHEEREFLQKALLKRYVDEGIPLEAAKSLSRDNRLTKEAYVYHENLKKEAFLDPKEISKISNAETLKDFEESLLPLIKSCDLYREKSKKGAQLNQYFCQEPSTSCAINPGRLQAEFKRNADLRGLASEDIWAKLKKLLLKEKVNRAAIRDMWTTVGSAKKNGTLQQDVGKLAILRSLEESGVIPGNTIQAMISKHLGVDPKIGNEGALQSFSRKIDQLALLLRHVTKDREDSQLFTATIGHAAYYSNCQQIYNGGEENGIPFLFRKDVQNSIFAFNSELSALEECANLKKDSVIETFILENRKQTLIKLKEIGAENLLQGDRKLLASVWKDMPEEIQGRLKTILRGRAESFARDEIVSTFAMVDEQANGAKAERASELVWGTYLDPEKIQSSLVASVGRKNESKDKNIPKEHLKILSDSLRNDMPSKTSDPYNKVLKLETDGVNVGKATVEYQLPDGTTQTTEVKWDVTQTRYEMY